MSPESAKGVPNHPDNNVSDSGLGEQTTAEYHTSLFSNALARATDKLVTARDKAGNILSAIGTDYHDSDHKFLTVAAGVGTLGVQVVDRARAAVLVVPLVAADVLVATNSPAEAAIAGGATFAAWCAAVGISTTEGLNQFPNATRQVGEEFPGFVSVFEDALPGLEKPIPTKNIAKRAGKRVLTGLQRGVAAVGIGTTAYVSTASAQGKERKEIHKLNMKVSLDGGFVVGGVVLGVGETIAHVAASHPELAEVIQNDATNTDYYFYAALALMTGQFAGARIKAFRNRNKSSDLNSNNLADSQTDQEQ
jgi:hypothetical protein